MSHSLIYSSLYKHFWKKSPVTLLIIHKIKCVIHSHKGLDMVITLCYNI